MPEVLDTPAPAPAPAAAPARSQHDETFAGLEALGRAPSTGSADDGPQPKPPAAPKKAANKIIAPDEPKPTEKPPEEAPDELPNPEDTPKPADKPEPAPAASKIKKPGDLLRDELAKTKARAEALEAENKTLKAPKEDPEKKSLTERLTQEEKRRKEIEDELRFANYERSPEFQEKYQKPYLNAWTEAMSDLEETVVPTADGSMRKATKDDLMKIVNLPIQQAGELAEQLFGKAERTMMDHRSNLLKTYKAQQAALTEGRKMAEQREQEMSHQSAKQQAELDKLQAELRSSHEPDFVKRHPELVLAKNEKGEIVDPKLQELLDRDRSVTDTLFSKESKLSPEKKLELHAEMRNRASHFGVVLNMARNAQKENSELREKLKQFEGSQPGKGDGNREIPPELREASNMSSVLDGLNKFAREKTGP
jgi:hypothetical protein